MNAKQWTGLAVGATGFAIFGASAGWLPAVGLFVALWGYGIQIAGNADAEKGRRHE